ncbi:MAG: DinB family protein [Waddliaceae bacterium]
MYTTIKDFLDSFTDVSQKTIQIFDSLSDESLAQEIAPGFRNIGRISWHIVQTIPEMMERTELKISGPSDEEEVPSTSKEILDTYMQVAKELVEVVQKEWKDETLRIEDDMYGEKWSRAKTCLCLIEHQIHHLGQITVLMRQANLPVPGICGPSKEEWQQFGMPPPKI